MACLSRSHVQLILLTISLVHGCDNGATAPDGGSDSGAQPDAGHTDPGNTDAGRMDAGHSDAGHSDAAAEDGRHDDAGLPPGTHPDIVRIIDVEGQEPGSGWQDSYSVGDQCYCDSSFDHGIGDVEVQTPVGTRTVRQVCDAIGPGPGSHDRPIYNDIQCGNGPPNDQADEERCPGRVDIGREGCGHIGPTWDLSMVE